VSGFSPLRDTPPTDVSRADFEDDLGERVLETLRQHDNLLIPQGVVPSVTLMREKLGSDLLAGLYYLSQSLNPQLWDLHGEELGATAPQLAMCVLREVSEVLETIPEARIWRKKNSQKDSNTAEEVIDSLIFLVLLARVKGVTYPDLVNAAVHKSEVLAQRFNRGEQRYSAGDS